MDAQLLAPLTPLLQKAIQTPTAQAPNIISALQKGFDPGLMNTLFASLYAKRALDGVDRYTGLDALKDLDNQYGPRELIPTESAYDAALAFDDKNKKVPLPEETGLPIPDEYDEEDMMRIHEGEGWEDGTNYKNPLRDWYRRNKR